MKIPSSPIPILLVGPPGVGKTAAVSASYDFVEVMLASTLTEEDIAGLPFRKGDYDYRTIPAMFRRLHEMAQAGKTTALFLDELDKARRSVADTLLTLVASRKVGESSLPKNTAIIAAANPPEMGGGDGISDAMISRFAVMDFIPDVRRWSAWARARFPSASSHRVISAVECGEMPLLDIAGEGLFRRITSPRTIAYVLEIVESECNERNALIGGLVTAGTASQIIHLLAKEDNDVLSTAADLHRRSRLRKIIAPLRLP